MDGIKSTQNNYQLKQVAENMKFTSPVEVVAQMMRKNSEELSKLKKEFDVTNEGNDKILAAMAVQVFSLEKILSRYTDKLHEAGLKPVADELRITRNKMTQVLEGADIHITDLTGMDIEEAIYESAEVIGWLPGEREKEYVLETYEPLVKKADKVIQMAKITGGSPRKEK